MTTRNRTFLTLAIVAMAAFVLTATSANAALIESDIDISNPYVPVALQYEGAQFRLVFRTDDDYQALSTSIDWYNAQVTTEANTNTDLNGLGWYVIGSTSAVSAKANTYTGTSDTTVPIYALAGHVVSDTYNNLWDGDNIDGLIQDTPQGAVKTAQVHSGTKKEGVTSSYPLGGALSEGTLYTNWGDPSTTYQNWIHKSGGWPVGWGANPSANVQGLYGMSGVLTVVSEPDQGAIPEPATMCALGLAVAGLGGYVRKRRKA